MRVDALPAIFNQYNRQVENIRKQTGKEWSSSCPKCGGDDRCRWFLDDKPLGWCRQCSSLFWPDASEPLSQEELGRFRKEQEQRELARKRSAEHALKLLRTNRLWEHYHEQLPGYGYRLWIGRGLDESWQSWFGVGYCPDWRGGDTLTIPYFDHGRDVLNIKHRLLQTNEQGGKYRYELSGQPQHLYLTDPTVKVAEHVVIVEGEIKAMVTFSRFQGLPIIGIPGATPPKYLLPQLEKCDRITLVLDPGAEVQAYDLAKALGVERCRVLITAMKIDDGILAANLSGRDIHYLLSQAREI